MRPMRLGEKRPKDLHEMEKNYHSFSRYIIRVKFKRSLKFAQELVGFFLAYCKRRQKSDGMFTGTARENVVVEKETFAEFGSVTLNLDADHKPSASHFFQLRNFLKFIKNVFTDFRCIFHKFLIAHHFEHGDSCRTTEMIASECCSEHTFDRFDLGGDEHC